MSELLARISTGGPLKSLGLANNTLKCGLCCDCKPARKALEQLYMQGNLWLVIVKVFKKAMI
jgi:uncharacterized protein YcaQ